MIRLYRGSPQLDHNWIHRYAYVYIYIYIYIYIIYIYIYMFTIVVTLDLWLKVLGSGFLTGFLSVIY